MSRAASKTFKGITATGTFPTGPEPYIAAPGGAPFATYAVEVKGTGAAPTSWTVTLQGSLDGVNWTTICTHTNTTNSDGDTVWDTNGKPVLFLRVDVSALALGSATDIAVTVVAVP